jgi:ABC-type branched-subunit amino acid transport system substrate-binding protein
MGYERDQLSREGAPELQSQSERRYGMHRIGRIATACLLVIALIATLCLSCAEEVEKGKVTITLGHISDMTGPAASALVPINYALDDLVRYYNEEGTIPGVHLKVVAYDARYDPSRDVPGWDWVKERGAQIVFTALPPTAETLKPFAGGDKIPLLSMTTSPPLIDPPGWVFCMNVPIRYQINAMLKWISEEDWDYQAEGRRPRIGSAGWEEPFAISCRDAIRDYAENHSDKFEYIAGPLSPMGAMTWTGEVARLKDCDYVFPPTTGTGTSSFMKEFRDKGYSAKFIGTEAHASFRDLVVDSVGWDGLDGMLACHPSRWWNETDPIVNLAKQLLYQYHASQADDVVYAGMGYIGGFCQLYGFFQILKEAVEEVGADNFDGQAYYDTAIGFKMTWEGYEEWDFSETKRYAWNYVSMYEWSAQEQDIIRMDVGWLPLVIE